MIVIKGKYMDGDILRIVRSNYITEEYYEANKHRGLDFFLHPSARNLTDKKNLVVTSNILYRYTDGTISLDRLDKPLKSIETIIK